MNKIDIEKKLEETEILMTKIDLQDSLDYLEGVKAALEWVLGYYREPLRDQD